MAAILAGAAMLSAPPWRTDIVLTKRPGAWLRMLPPACWVGVSIETQKQIGRWPLLRNWGWPDAIKFMSVEPMLGPVTRGVWRGHCDPDWVIAGPETGAKARPCQDEWIEKLAAESPCFFDKRKEAGVRREWPG
jgi:protein gp37